MIKPPRLDLNPSSADRWTTCTASPRFILDNADKLPISTDTVYNVEGTAAHEVAASMLKDFKLSEDPSGDHSFKYTDEMFLHGWNYAEYVLSLRKPGSTMIVEQKIPLWYMKGRHMMLDVGIKNPDSLHIVDYKYGEGVVVSPVENLQTAIYAIGFGSLGEPLPTDFPVFIHIYQPRGRAAEDGAPRVWETTWLELCNLTRKVTEVAEGIQNGTEIPMFAPSDKACRWCPAKGFCMARRDALTEGLEVIDAQPRPLPSPSLLTPIQIQKLLTHKKGIISWLDDVEEWAQQRLTQGHKVPGFKLVQSRGGNRYWSDPKLAGELLLKETVLKRDEVIEEKVISPGAVEKLLGKRALPVDLVNLIARNAGEPVIAPESDKRPALCDSAVEDFEVLP